MTPQEREDAALDSLVARSARVAPGRIEAYGPHPDQLIEWYAPGTTSGPPLVLVHGGFFRPSTDRVHVRLTASVLAEALDAPVVLAEYRRIHGQPDTALADVRAISDLLEGMYEDTATWVGHSAGGTLALMRAFDEIRPTAPVVALAPITDLRRGLQDRLGDGALEDWLSARTAARPARYAQFDPIRLLTEVPERLAYVQCLHGADDLTVPAAQSGESGIPHRIVPGAHHYDLIDPEAPAWSQVIGAVQHLRGPVADED